MKIFKWEDLFGNSSTKLVLRSSLRNKKFPHISVMAGVYGTGKTSSAEISAMTLTCLHPEDGAPCYKCSSCISNIDALQKTGKSENIIKFNAGKEYKKSDMENIIKQIFTLQSFDNVVYIIEEAHVLDDTAQTALLEELDKIDEKAYVIFVTTKSTRLLPELRSRAMNFNFSRLTTEESKKLLQSILEKENIRMDSALQEIVLKYSKGIPRTLRNLIDFIKDGDYAKETLQEFLGMIDPDEFTNLFSLMKKGDMPSFVETLDSLLRTKPHDIFLEQFKEYALDALFYKEGILQNFDSTKWLELDEIFENVDMLRVVTEINKIPYRANQTEIKFGLLKVYQIINKNSNICNNAELAKKQVVQARENAIEVTHFMQELQNEVKSTDLNLHFLDSLNSFN